jgi:hypothetical protein
MSMDNPLPKAGAQKNLEIAAAEWLFQDSPAPESNRPAGPQFTPGSGEEFELTELPENAAMAASSAPAAKEPPGTPPRSRMAPPSSPPVEQVWSRTAEWGPTLLLLLGWGALVLALLYFSLGAEFYQVAALVFLLGVGVAIIISYPILITLERPVRITPEQAARDYYGALSHHVPHFRRMWLLLSAKGRTSHQFASLEGFKAYWIKRLAQLREGHATSLSPLVFQVEDFRAEKSAGKSEIDAQFSVNVLVRGRRNHGPIGNLTVDAGFVRGPDSMWYLNEGTLPDRPAVRGGESGRPGRA